MKFGLLTVIRVSFEVWSDLITTCAADAFAKPMRRPVMTPFQPGCWYIWIIVRVSGSVLMSCEAGG